MKGPSMSKYIAVLHNVLYPNLEPTQWETEADNFETAVQNIFKKASHLGMRGTGWRTSIHLKYEDRKAKLKNKYDLNEICRTETGYFDL